MEKGLTLVELLIVIAIITILSAVAIPNFVRYREIYITKGDMQKVVSFINLAKSVSLKYNEQVCLSFPKGKNPSISMFIDSDRSKTFTSGEKIEQTLKLNEEMEITSDNLIVCIPPTGIVLGTNNTIVFRYGQQQRRVIVSGYGRVKVERQ
ncbi:MAG: prepilin-type N-terminal cleavage/methylation domain-containing protein [Proteobacteria bacterium]|nr:prepilin-type N-terminal cleavage/methylation domain-containing protein [Pseudomonadota bacterium]